MLEVTLEGKNLPGADQAALLPLPRGLCAGVIRAIEFVNRASHHLGLLALEPKEIGRNCRAAEVASSSAALVPSGHGNPQSVRPGASERRSRVIDATCPVTS
jgi:4-hydroxy-3-methylbut-2-en-1-yl diphosphate reductase